MENWLCGSDATGSTRFATKMISPATWITFTSTPSSIATSSAFVIGRIRPFTDMRGRDCCRKTGRVMPAKVGLLSVSGPREADRAEVEFPDIASLIRATDYGRRTWSREGSTLVHAARIGRGFAGQNRA